MRISKKDILIIITFAFLFVSLSGLVEIEWDGCSRIKVECVEGEPCVMPVCATSFFPWFANTLYRLRYSV